jgi:hypothetical protein
MHLTHSDQMTRNTPLYVCMLCMYVYVWNVDIYYWSKRKKRFCSSWNRLQTALSMQAIRSKAGIILCMYVYIFCVCSNHLYTSIWDKADCVWVGRRRSRPKAKPRFEPFENCVFRVAQTWLNGIFPSPREFCGQLKRKQLYNAKITWNTPLYVHICV